MIYSSIIQTTAKHLAAALLSAVTMFFPQEDIKHRRALTPIEQEDLISVMKESYFNVHKAEPSEGTIAGAWAHIALENKHGRRVWNHNFGNIGKLPEEPPSTYYSHFGKAKYRSFKNFVQGGEAYWRFMTRCKIAMRHFEKKRPRDASLSLKRCNYYKSDQEQYADALSSLYSEGIRRARSHRSSR
jgi:hypothetical protein